MIDHFPVVITPKIDGPSEQSSKTKHLYKRSYDEENMKVFNHRLLMTNWDGLKNCDDPSETYKQFFKIFNSIYDIYFPKISVRIKTKHIRSLWKIKGLAKSSRRKQKLETKSIELEHEQKLKTKMSNSRY